MYTKNPKYTLGLMMIKASLGLSASHLVELAHDEHSDPHEVKHTVEKHPEHPRRAGGDLRDVVPKAIFSVAGNTVNTPVCRNSDVLSPK